VIFIDMAKNNLLKQLIYPLAILLSFITMSSYYRIEQETKNVFVSGVENRVKIGKLTNNKNLAFGCKNIFQEILQDKEFNIVENAESADLIFSAEILYFDVNKTKRNISVFHSDVEETLVVMRGVITDKNGKKIKEAVAEESSSEISTSTLITDEGSGKINLQSHS